MRVKKYILIYELILIYSINYDMFSNMKNYFQSFECPDLKKNFTFVEIQMSFVG